MVNYTKLKSGNWGVRIDGNSAKPGDVVEVTKKDGTTKDETIEAVIWTGDGVSVYSIVQQQRGGCSCTDSCCRPRCDCGRECNCRGGNIYDC